MNVQDHRNVAKKIGENLENGVTILGDPEKLQYAAKRKWLRPKE